MRPIKLDSEVQGKVLMVTQLCGFIGEAAAFAGINRRTLLRWIRRGKHARSGTFADFYRKYRRAEAIAQLRALAAINAAAEAGAWQAAAWRLERSDPKHWGRRVIVEKEPERKPKAPKVIG